MTTRLDMLRRRLRDDQGVTLILVAILSVALLLVAALAVDGGVAYANRRQMQNAADAAAVSGTRAVDQLRFGGKTDGGIIWDAVDGSRQSNKATTMKCWLLSPAKVRLTGDVCASRSTMASTWNALKAAGTVVAGVETDQTGVKQTYLAKIGGIDTVTAKANAAATIQPYVGGGAAPFIICGYLGADPQAYDMLNADGTFKSSAFTRYGPGGVDAPIRIQGGGQAQNGGVPGCGLGASFDGKLDQDVTTVVVGTPAKAEQGNGFNSNTRDAVVQAGLTPCPTNGPYNGCGMLLPIANASNGGNGNSMYITPAAWGVFKMYGNGTGNPKYSGELLAEGSVVDGGIGGTGDVTQGQARLIKLVK